MEITCDGGKMLWEEICICEAKFWSKESEVVWKKGYVRTLKFEKMVIMPF